jgi:hypothetical protein
MIGTVGPLTLAFSPRIAQNEAIRGREKESVGTLMQVQFPAKAGSQSF